MIAGRRDTPVFGQSDMPKCEDIPYGVLLTACDSPSILSSRIHQCSAEWSAEGLEDGFWERMGVTLPESLASAVTKRKAEFVAGRVCAARALRMAGCAGPSELLVSPDRTPVWPEGFVGSITHTKGFVSAAVASGADMRSVGIDSERIMSERTSAQVKGLVAGGESSANWLAPGETPPLTQVEWTTLIFSAKESVYKCLYPVVKTFLGFADVRCVACDWAARKLTLRLVRDASGEFGAGTELSSRWEIVEPYIHTAVELAW